MLFTYLPEYWAPPVRWSLDLEIILILPDRGGTVLIKLVQVGPDSIALVPALGSSLCLLGPTNVAARTHPSQLEWQHPQASTTWALASGSKGKLKVRTRLNNVSLFEQCSFLARKDTFKDLPFLPKLLFSTERKIIPNAQWLELVLHKWNET